MLFCTQINPKGRTTMSSPILTAARMKVCDGYTINTVGIPSQVLMERAAREASLFLNRRGDLFPEGKALLLCGSGNNGGDGFAMARFLSDGSCGTPRETAVLYTGRLTPDGSPDPDCMSPECARQYGLTKEAWITILPMSRWRDAVQDAAMIVDAVFGIGLDRPVAGVIGALLAQNRARIGVDLTVTEIAAAGVYLHAAAGDLAAEELGEYGMLPSDLIERLPTVCKGFSGTGTRLERV